MQLFFLCVLLLVGSDGEGQALAEQLGPVVEEYGDEQTKAAFREAQQISSVIGAVRELQAQFNSEPPKNFNGENQEKSSENGEKFGQNQTENTQKTGEDKGVIYGEDGETEVLKNDLLQGEEKLDNFMEGGGEENMVNLSFLQPIAAIASKEILARLSKELQKN